MIPNRGCNMVKPTGWDRFDEYDCWLCMDTKTETVHQFSDDGQCVTVYERPCSFCKEEEKVREIGKGLLNTLKWWIYGGIGVIVALVALLAWKW